MSVAPLIGLLICGLTVWACETARRDDSNER